MVTLEYGTSLGARIGSYVLVNCEKVADPDPVKMDRICNASFYPAKHLSDSGCLCLQAADMGVYTCTASNLAGAITTNITLNVLESPHFVKPMQDRKVIYT